MAIFSSLLITRFSQEAENEFAREFPCILDRETLSIVSGTSIYTLPSHVIDVRKITWKGLRINPLSHRRYREYFDQVSTGSTPECYIYNNIGISQIKFFPIPNVTIAGITTNLWGSEIANRVIVEYYRTPDYSVYTIPAFIRRRLLKAYVMWKCFSIEGRGQNLKAAKYWEGKWQYLKVSYSNLLEDLINEPRRIIVGGSTDYNDNRGIPTPQLPYNYRGIGVDKGE